MLYFIMYLFEKNIDRNVTEGSACHFIVLLVRDKTIVCARDEIWGTFLLVWQSHNHSGLPPMRWGGGSGVGEGGGGICGGRWAAVPSTL